jgi:hypothetical protein
MFKSKALLAGIVLALVVVYSPAAMAKSVGAERPPSSEQPLSLSVAKGMPTVVQEGTITEIPADIPDDVLGYYTTDGGKTFTPIKEEKGVAERIASGTSKREFMAAHRMSSEAEAKIVHIVPPVPVTIDGILYQPDQIHLFDGKQLGFTVGNDGQVYAFSTFEALDDFLAEQPALPTSGWPYEYSVFYEGFERGGLAQLAVLPGVSIPYLDYMNDIISSMEISAYAANGCTLFDGLNYQGDYFAKGAGTYWPNLGWYNWNDRASSLIVWPR